ncbi:Hachiman antiphage defense system protein HamA [Vibrio sp. 99-8-1]|uniref:Hachiman antiphage defense system protein HamA n=1 Tax=Vibrio sp. 99-8-1 TaxID=2607602 RepID=UPI001493CF5A|nr:Hachiman antiphage defense system protein HamA [Vibrio sp. 99-8-1]NOI68339.1 DUF1837 domain-containing protein [Vibrio sp. 99-8-1]
MVVSVDGIQFQDGGDFACCHVFYLSDELKELIRTHLVSICHGSQVSDYLNSPLYSYKTTINSFLARYEKKSNDTKKGMIGEFLSHILITSMFKEYEITSAYFNLEEKSIKKGFDLLLYNTEQRAMWITEVKSGECHQGKTNDQTTRALLNTAKNDLHVRLNAQEEQYWLNAINHVKAAVHDEKDYRKVLLDILVNDAGGSTVKGTAKSQNKNVFLVSNLFAPMSSQISWKPAEDLAANLSDKSTFANVITFSIQKETYQKVVDFLHEEIA